MLLIHKIRTQMVNFVSVISSNNRTFENNIDGSYVITCDMNRHEYCAGDGQKGYTLYGNYYDNSNMCIMIN